MKLKSGYSVAELLILGFDGKTLSNETIQNFKRENPALFILFTAPNFESKEQLIAVTEELQARVAENGSRLPAIISADQEGGRVQRFRNGFTLLPPALKVGKKQSPELAHQLATLQAKELFAAGINLNFAPDCDINTNPENPVIGDRAFGDQEALVSQMTAEVVKAHLEQNVQACLKHFPGHGDTHLDSHEALPFVTTPLEVLKTREWVPFKRGIDAGAQFVMSAHILLPHLDEKFPGTLSATFLKTYLRGELQFEGAIVSDDMEMGAITKNYGADEAPILALLAGCDLLIYRHESAALVALEAIKKALKDGRLSTSLIEASIDRVRKIRARLTFASRLGSVATRAQLIGQAESLKFVERGFHS